eukprot:11493601-Alexandrium_andersonii.AAC.1
MSDEVSGAKTLCKPHQKDIWAIEKAAAKTGETDLWLSIYADDAAVYDFLIKWRAQVGESKGRGVRRSGKFNWAQYKAWYFRRVGTRRST